MCISFAVMLPVGNPPNAIVFSYGHCQIKDMVSGGHPPAASLHSASRLLHTPPSPRPASDAGTR